jgi:hypothetical protein
VSGVNASAVSGVQVLDDTKLATYATLGTAGGFQTLCIHIAILYVVPCNKAALPEDSEST